MIKEHFLRTFFDSLNKENIDYFVYGSYQNLPVDTGGSDIDMVVDEKDMAKVEQIISNLTQHICICLASFYKNANANAKFYRFLSIDWGVQIDVLYNGLCYNGIEYYPKYLMTNCIIEHNGIRVLDKKKGFYVDYIKEIIHNGKAKEKYRKAFVELVNRDSEKYLYELKCLYGENALKLIQSNLSVEGLNSIGKELQKELQKNVLKGHLLKRLYVNSQLFLRLFQKRPGYVIVVEGTDGSGKSTIINHITPILEECFHGSVVYNHLRPNVIPDLGVLLGKKDKQDANVVNTDPHGQKPSGFVGSIFRWGYYMIDYTFGYLKTVWPQIHTKSKVFIFDRYYYDYYIDQLRSRTSLPNWILRFGECFIPTPDLILCLGGNPEKIYVRKPETSLEEVKRQTKVLQEFCSKRKNAVWVDTTLSIDESCKNAMVACYNTMSKRFQI